MSYVAFVTTSVLLLLASVRTHPVKHHYMWMPDGEGRLHLQDLNAEEVTPRVNAESDVSLLLYTRANPTTARRIIVGDDSTLGNFQPQKPTKLIIHGWNSSWKNLDHIRAAYISRGDYNVVVVDWSGPAGSMYSTAKSNTRPVGEFVAQFLEYIVSKGASLDNINIAGHSLGAHIAGIAGNRVRGVLAKITGLDPALPLYGSEGLPNRLDTSDARFVEVIHTCGGLLGFEEVLGHSDFYPNGGKRVQPGCGLDLAGSCSHSRSHQYFAESITTTVGFRGSQCGSWNDFTAGRCSQNPTSQMGEYTNISSRGAYFVRTASSSPYALG